MIKDVYKERLELMVMVQEYTYVVVDCNITIEDVQGGSIDTGVGVIYEEVQDVNITLESIHGVNDETEELEEIEISKITVEEMANIEGEIIDSI